MHLASVRGLRAGSSSVELGDDWSAPVQVAFVRTPVVREIHLRARPVVVSGGLASQARSAYQSLMAGLASVGATAADLVTEKVFLADVAIDTPLLLEARAGAMPGGGRGEDRGPALTLVEQPPLHPRSLCEIQAFGLIHENHGMVADQRMDGLPEGTTGRIIEAADVRSVFISGITGGAPGDDLDFTGQARSAFRRAEEILLRHGFTFRDVVRTWIYLPRLLDDYDALNMVRREFYRLRRVHPAPASTGIRGAPSPGGRLIGIDVRAVSGLPRGAVTPVHGSTLNEAPSYGSDFSRGTRVDYPDRSVIYISGTASIDQAGQVVHVGSIERQVERMLVNIENLLRSQRVGLDDLVSLTTYLKRPEDGDAFLRAAAARGLLPRVPHTICHADVCRDAWLCETEAVAVTA